MVNRWITYLLLSVMLIYTFSQTVIVTDYLINIEYITKVFCINKERPKMNCNGKCHLKKQLQKDEEKKSNTFKKGVEISLICESNTSNVIDEPVLLPLSDKGLFIYLESHTFEYCEAIYYPPIV